jgi:myo-inositol-1-phosphate synthase
MDFVYVAFRVRRRELKRAVEGVRALGIVGLNVTRPHKTSVMQLLDRIERTAREIGAVNTIVRSGNELHGYNTDAQAALDAGCAMINCMPEFIASDGTWSRKFEEKGLPIAGDDIKSQLGATILHRAIARLAVDRGASSTKHIN